MIDKKPDIAVLCKFPQCEWDFRNLYDNEDQLSIATMYEYLRECPWIREVYEKLTLLVIIKPGDTENSTLTL
jgi:hypothetical protein